jgi:DNA repair photolyase
LIKDAPRALRTLLFPDYLFCYRYSLAPYRGCGHACRYCDGRAEKYHVEGDFENDIIIRRNLPELLEAELSRLREKGLVSVGSGTSDSWQPAEAEHRLTEKILDVLLAGSHPVKAITKSDLILRDRETLGAINRKNGALVFVTVTSADDEVSQVFEPGAPASDARIEAIRRLSEDGIPVAALVMPLFPGLTDTDSALEILYARLKEAGVIALIPGHLTLRPGRQKELFFATLEHHYPGLVNLYGDLFREDRPSGNPVGAYRKELYPRLIRMARQFRLPFLVPHSVFSPLVSRCDGLLILLEQMEMVYSQRGMDITPLKNGSERYRIWLGNLRKDFNRRRSLPPGYPDEVLDDFVESGNFAPLLGNVKLAGHLVSVLKEGLKWDILTGQWH